LIALKAELAGKLIAIAPERAAAEIRDVENVTRDALREVRAAIGGYRSEGLPAELARARLTLEAAGVRPEYFIVPLSLPAAAEAALALAVREAVTNVVRHAGATACHITLERRGEAVRLEVADDGRGAADAALASGGMGLRVMRERLSGLGGQVEIESAAAAAGGTRLCVTLPNCARAAEPAPAATAVPAEAVKAAGEVAGVAAPQAAQWAVEPGR
jgi:two-component system sensor histidine kinase DesK